MSFYLWNPIRQPNYTTHIQDSPTKKSFKGFHALLLFRLKSYLSFKMNSAILQFPPYAHSPQLKHTYRLILLRFKFKAYFEVW